MADTPRYTPEQLSILLRVAAGKLGRDPVKLQDVFENVAFPLRYTGLSGQQIREKVTALLSDREGLAQLLQSEQVRQLLQQLLSGQNPS